MMLKNKYCLIVLLLGLYISSIGQSNVKTYKLKSIINNANFNYQALHNFDNLSDVQEAFKPIQKGNFTVYTFIATFKGLGYWVPQGKTSLDSTYDYKVDKNGYRILTKEEEKEQKRLQTFHDILIIKTNFKNEIIDAYQYTLEWAEPELSYDLFRSKAKKQKLINGLSIEKLKFYRTQKNREKESLNEKGIIKLK